MLLDSEQQAITMTIKDRSSAFVDDHADVWVTGEDGGVLVLAADDCSLLFDAAADWLREEPELHVIDAQWQLGPVPPRHLMRLRLRPKPAADSVG
ncbi:hypothetical protein [Phaeacidiphilus oryzae]|jgi:hypothetical protein|uniref:hypothetical protein n=1 Tax=Phaeacidiphilus oryzae TaxID=348818 RepID=UPI00055D2833|nr:hypothetical protein [Phaeacidiphilus oryzae]